MDRIVSGFQKVCKQEELKNSRMDFKFKGFSFIWSQGRAPQSDDKQCDKQNEGN